VRAKGKGEDYGYGYGYGHGYYNGRGMASFLGKYEMCDFVLALMFSFFFGCL
jgi:hypothetical protein